MFPTWCLLLNLCVKLFLILKEIKYVLVLDKEHS